MSTKRPHRATWISTLERIAEHRAALREVGVPLVPVCQSGQRVCQAQLRRGDRGPVPPFGPDSCRIGELYWPPGPRL